MSISISYQHKDKDSAPILVLTKNYAHYTIQKFSFLQNFQILFLQIKKAFWLITILPVFSMHVKHSSITSTC